MPSGSVTEMIAAARSKSNVSAWVSILLPASLVTPSGNRPRNAGTTSTPRTSSPRFSNSSASGVVLPSCSIEPIQVPTSSTAGDACLVSTGEMVSIAHAHNAASLIATLPYRSPAPGRPGAGWVRAPAMVCRFMDRHIGYGWPMFALDTRWFDVAVVTSLFAVGSILFGRFEEHKPRWQRVVKFLIVTTVVIVIIELWGRAFAYTLLALPV